MHSLLRTVLAASLTAPCLVSQAADCSAPRFTEATFGAAAPSQPTVPVRAAGMLSIDVPRTFEGITFSGDATVFGYANGARIVIGVETPASIALHEAGAKPEPFFRSTLTGSTAAGCKRLESYKLEQEDYRVRGRVGKMDIFAHGTSLAHEVFVLDPARPDTVVRVRFSGYERHTVESLLATMKPR